MSKKDQKKKKPSKAFVQDEQEEKKEQTYLLYKLLNVQRSATPDQIKKGYRKMALKHHPDKASPENRDKATQQFQKLTEAYQILSNPEKKAIYDQTGVLDGDDIDFFSAFQFFFTKRVELTMEDIDAYLKQFQGSSKQDDELISYYNKKKGNIKKIISEFPGSQNKDIQRFVKKIQDLIKQGKIKKYIKSFNSCKAKIQKVFEDIDETKEQFDKRADKKKEHNLEEDEQQNLYIQRDSDYQTQEEVEITQKTTQKILKTQKPQKKQGKPRLKIS